MRRWTAWTLRHRWPVLGGVLLLTLLALASLSRAHIATSAGALFFGDSPRYRAYQARVRQFANDEFFVVAYEDTSPLSAESLDRLQRIVERLKALPDVARVESLIDAARLQPRDGGVEIVSYAATARRDPGRQAALLAELRRDPLAGWLVGRDGRHAAVHVELTVDPSRPVERAPRLVEEAAACFLAAGFRREQIHLAGLPALFGEIIDQTYFNLQRLLPLAALALLVAVWVVFRRTAPVVVSMGVALIGVIWCMGLAVLLDRNLNILISVVPAVVLVVSFSDVIHLWSAYLIELQAGRTRDEAILESAADVGTACLLTSGTTFVGFVCLSFVPTPVFRQLGLVLGFGVAVALLLALTLVPIVLSLFPAPRELTRRRDRLGPAIGWMARLATGRPRLVIASFAALALASGVGLLGFHIETDFQRRLAPGNRFRADQRFFDERFAGTNVIELFVTLPAGLDPARLQRLLEFEQAVAALPQVDRVISLLGALRAAGPAALLLPAGTARMTGIERLVDIPRRTLRLAVRLRRYGMRETHEAGLAIAALGRRHLDGDVQLEVTGLTYLLGWWLDGILAGQRNGLVVSIALIAAMMVLGTGSLRVGLWSMVPNLLPLLVVAGYVGAAWEQIDSDTLIIGMLAIGIGVDDTIHFLMRYRLEARRGLPRGEALQAAYRFAGRAIVITSAILVIGFAPFAFSDYFSIRIMGTLLPAVLVVALVADLLLVPALVQIGWMAYD